MRNNFMVIEVWDKKTSAHNDQVLSSLSFVFVAMTKTVMKIPLISPIFVDETMAKIRRFDEKFFIFIVIV